MIQPTVGRVVWYHPMSNPGMSFDSHQPLAAIITYVHNDAQVNLTVFDKNGATHALQIVPLFSGTEAERGNLFEKGYPFAEWMPYQKGQAAKTEQLENKLAEA